MASGQSGSAVKNSESGRETVTHSTATSGRGDSDQDRDSEAPSTSQRIGGYLYGLLSRSLSRNATDSKSNQGGSDMAQNRRPGQSSDFGQINQFETTNAENDFLNVELKKTQDRPGAAAGTSHQMGFDDNDDGSTVLDQALKQNEELLRTQDSHLKKISELEKKLKQRESSELHGLKNDPSSSRRTATLPQNQEARDVGNKEKDKQIRQLQRELVNAQQLEGRVTELTIEVSKKDEEIRILKESLKKGRSQEEGHTEDAGAQQHIQKLSADLEKIKKHSKMQSREVHQLKQQAEAVELDTEQRFTSYEGLLEDTEKEKTKLLGTLNTVKAELGELKRTKQQMEREITIMKKREMDAITKSQLLEAQLDEGKLCSKKTCTNLRMQYNRMVAESSQLQKNLASMGDISAQHSESRKTYMQQKKTIAGLMEKLEAAQSQATSNKLDFEEERKDRLEAHSKFADLEVKAAKKQSHFDQERAAYEQRIGELQQDFDEVKSKLKSHMQELAHFEQYSKRLGDQVRELTEEKTKIEKRLKEEQEKITTLRGKAQTYYSKYKQCKAETETLNAQLSQAAKSLASLAEDKDQLLKKSKKKTDDEVAKAMKKLRKNPASTKSTLPQQKGESAEKRLAEIEKVYEEALSTTEIFRIKNDELETEVSQLRKINKEMTKVLTAGPKAIQKYSHDPSTSHTEQFSEMPYTEEQTAGIGGYQKPAKTAPVPAMSSPVEAEPHLPSVSQPGPIKTQPRRSNVHSSQTSPSEEVPPGRRPLGFSDRISGPAPVKAVAPQPTNVLSPMTNESFAENLATKNAASEGKKPLRAYIPPPPSGSESIPQLNSPIADYANVPGRPPSSQPPAHQRYKGDRYATPQQPPFIDNLQYLEGQQQPQYNQSAGMQNRNPQAPLPGHSVSQGPHQQPRLQAAGDQLYFQSNQYGGNQFLQQPQLQGRSYSDQQRYVESGGIRYPMTKPSYSHPQASGMPGYPTNLSVHPSQNFQQQQQPHVGAQFQADHQSRMPLNYQPQQPNFVPSEEASHGATDVSADLVNPYPPSGQTHPPASTGKRYENAPHPQPRSRSSSGSTPVNASGKSSAPVPKVSPNQPMPDRCHKSDEFHVGQPYQQSIVPSQPVPTARNQPAEPQSPTNPVNPNESAGEEQFKNALQYKIDKDIEDVAAEVREEVSGGRVHQMTDTRRPYDPNLICPVCDRPFRIGEIQKYRAHVKGCEGTVTSKPGAAAVANVIFDDDDPGTEV